MRQALMAPENNYQDVLIVGAGLSGIGAAAHLQKHCPGKSYTILEGRATIGGTWDLFRYPGVRSDSDMYTLGYGFRPWREAKAIADGPSILSYVRETAEVYAIDKRIRFNHWVTEVSWSSQTARWTLTAMHDGAPVTFTCKFLLVCAGYYRYAEGYTPHFEGVSRFKGQIVHPQKWPEELDYDGKRVVVIGSGATAVTLIPAMAETAAHITMLQRSPSYMFSMPGHSPTAKFLSRFLPKGLVFAIVRWQRVFLQQVMFKLARARPKKTRENLIELVRKELGPNYDVDKHFAPHYNPWDQRLCLVPDNDLFDVIKSGGASVVTDQIETFTENGIKLKSGGTLEADIIVTATGLTLEAIGGARVLVDGKKIETSKTLTYKGLMFSGVPNLAAIFGYTNASWTLRSDLVSRYVCRLIKYLDSNGFVEARPVNVDPDMQTEPFLDFSSGYVKRAIDVLPKQGARQPWRHPQSYAPDFWNLRYGRINDGVMMFKTPMANAAPDDKKEALAAAE